MRGNPHARFGRRPGETERSKHRHRAPCRPHLALQATEETRRRVQQEQLGHRGRKHDPRYRIRNALRAGADRLTARQIERIETGLQAGDPDYEVTVAWRCYQQGRAQLDADDDMTSPTKTCLSRIDAGQRSQLPQPLQITINGIIELHRRIARGFRKTPTTTASA